MILLSGRPGGRRQAHSGGIPASPRRKQLVVSLACAAGWQATAAILAERGQPVQPNQSAAASAARRRPGPAGRGGREPSGPVPAQPAAGGAEGDQAGVEGGVEAQQRPQQPTWGGAGATTTLAPAGGNAAASAGAVCGAVSGEAAGPFPPAVPAAVRRRAPAPPSTAGGPAAAVWACCQASLSGFQVRPTAATSRTAAPNPRIDPPPGSAARAGSLACESSDTTRGLRSASSSSAVL